MADTNQQRTWSGINDESERKAEKGGRGKVACPLYPFRSLFITLLLFGFMGMFSSSTAHAGKGAYPDLIDPIGNNVINILIKHGLPVQHDRDNPWFKTAASTGNYKLSFYQADEVPQEAIIEVIRYCINLYDKRGRNEKFKILMYREVYRPQLRLFSDGNAYFKLTIGGND